MSSSNMIHSQHTAGSSHTPFSIGGGVILDPEKRKRNRTFIDPVSEVPRLEEWFILNTHPSHALIARYTDELNLLPYRQKVHLFSVLNLTRSTVNSEIVLDVTSMFFFSFPGWNKKMFNFGSKTDGQNVSE